MIGDRCLRVAHHAFILFLVVASAAVLSAQTVVDPRYVEFTPSADHNTNASDGTPLVQRYSLSVYPVGSSVAFDTMDLGKPAPSGGVIRVDFLPLLHSVPTPGVVFEARVTAVGPGGSTASSLSNGFSFQPACAPSINSTGQSVGSGGGTGTVGVTAGAGCTWSAASNAGWITLTGATGGTGNGSVPYSVAANTGSARTGTLTVAGRTYTVSQAALSCSYTVSPTSQAMPVGGGPALTDVTAAAGCAWTAVSNSTGWLTVTSGASGNGNGTVGFSTTANPNGTQRNGSITIATQTFMVSQAAAPCTYTLTPASQSVTSTGSTGSMAVAVPNGCAWTGVSNNSGWLTVTSGASGNGNGSVAFSVSANASSVPRTGTLTVGGQTFSVMQAGAPCTYSISPPSQSIAAGSATGSTNVTSPTGCTWSGVSNTGWLTVTSGATGSGNGSVGFSASANPSTSPRSGSLTVAGQTFTVTQAAAGCTFGISSNSLSVVAAGGTGSTNVTAGGGCAWSAASNDSWITVTSGASGSGNGPVGFSVAANPNASARTGTLTIATQTFSVTQAAAPCTYTLTPASQSVASTGSTGSMAVAVPNGCAWTGVSNNSGWLTVTSGASGNGNGSVAFSVSANASSVPRTGTLTVGGQTFSVMQAGAPCTYSISPPSQSIAAGSATGSTNVTSPTGCTWSGVSNTGWLTVTSGATGSGNGSVGFSASANTSTSQRSGTLTVADETFTVTQAAAGCTFAISSNSLSVVAAGGTSSTNVTSGSGCAWSAASNDGWITVTSGGSGSGNGPVGFSVAANPNPSARTGTLTIATRTFTVSQAASACSYSLTPTSRAVSSAGANTTTSVTTAAGCAWTAVSNTPAWLAITDGASGSGNDTVSLSANTNTTTQVRVGTATIAGQTFTVTQNAASCSFTVSPTTMQPPFAGANGSATVTTSNGCAWTAASNTSWITVTSGAEGTASGQVNFTVAPSMAASQRIGTLTIAGRSLVVTQAANTCSYVLTPANRMIGGEGGTGSITVGTASGCPWTATSSQSWITVSGTGTASGSASYTVSANATGTSRVGMISIGTQSFTITQGVPTGSAPVAPRGLRIVTITGSE